MGEVCRRFNLQGSEVNCTVTLGLLKGLPWQEEVTDQNILRKASAAPDGG